MKQLIISGLLSIILTTAFAQKKEVFGLDFTFIKGDKQFKGLNLETEIGNDENYFYSLRKVESKSMQNVPPKIFLIKRNDKMEQVSELKVPMSFNEYKFRYKNILSFHILGGKLISFVNYKNKKSKKTEILLVEYDKNSFAIKNTKTIASLNQVDKGLKLKYHIKIIEDKNTPSEIGIYLTSSAKSTKSPRSIYLIDSNLDKVFETSLTLKESGYQNKSKRNIITKDYITYITHDKQHYSLNVISRITKEYINLPIELNNSKEITSIELGSFTNDKINMCGFYEIKSGDKKGERGVFSQIFNLKSKQINSVKNSPLSDFDLKNSNSRYLNLKKGIANADGSLIIVGEYYSVIYHHPTAGSTAKPSITNIYGDLIFTRISSEGDIEWVKQYNKTLKTKEKYIGNLLIYDNKDYVQVLFNNKMDNPKAVQMNRNTRDLKAVQFNKLNGDYTEKIIFKNNELSKNGAAFLLDFAMETGSNKMIIPIAKRFKFEGIINVKF